MQTVKIVLLVLSGTIFTRAILPPRKPASPEATKNNDKKGVYKGQAFEHLVRLLSNMVWFAVLPTIITTILLALHDQYPQLAPLLCPANPDQLEPLERISPRFLLGALLTIAAGTLRLWSYHALGALFTFEVFIKDEHALVASGPYALVRHPSYTGTILMLLGEHLMQFGRAGYVEYCGVAHTPFAVLVYAWPPIALFGALSLWRRTAVEDVQLRDRFGGVWDEYAARVKWKLIPYVV
ncbi:hypothetical protein BD413DRAFT_487558 [Trametes elegans]|nr:hypothetical protein BD413DRAFT_487558 [Trametes elegans]